MTGGRGSLMYDVIAIREFIMFFSGLLFSITPLTPQSLVFTGSLYVMDVLCV